MNLYFEIIIKIFISSILMYFSRVNTIDQVLNVSFDGEYLSYAQIIKDVLFVVATFISTWFTFKGTVNLPKLQEKNNYLLANYFDKREHFIGIILRCFYKKDLNKKQKSKVNLLIEWVKSAEIVVYVPEIKRSLHLEKNFVQKSVILVPSESLSKSTFKFANVQVYPETSKGPISRVYRTQAPIILNEHDIQNGQFTAIQNQDFGKYKSWIVVPCYNRKNKTAKTKILAILSIGADSVFPDFKNDEQLMKDVLLLSSAQYIDEIHENCLS